VLSADHALWINLFSGLDYTGWKIVARSDPATAVVEEGAMVLQQRINTIEHTFVTSEKKYRDFILELDLKDDPGFNSGILLRCEDAPAAAATRLNGYQVKIDNSKRSSTGGIFDNFGDSWRWLFDLKDDANARAAFDLGEWSHFRIKCIGSGWMDRSPVVASRLCGAGGFPSWILRPRQSAAVALRLRTPRNVVLKKNWKLLFVAQPWLALA